jgi:two-component system, OmpR family, response regulator
MSEKTIKAALIEDDAKMCEILQEYLADFEIKLSSFRLPSEGLHALGGGEFDILILDLTLPQMDGLEVCKIVKKNLNMPIIITSARSAVSDRVVGLELGADDYLPKPFDPRELVARIRANVKKHSSDSIAKLGSNVFLVDESAMEIHKEGVLLSLTPAEFEVLKLLIENPNIVLTRDQIVDNVESMKWASIGKSVDVIVGRIRSKIGDDPKNPRYIKAIKGFGYKFTP